MINFDKIANFVPLFLEEGTSYIPISEQKEILML